MSTQPEEIDNEIEEGEIISDEELSMTEEDEEDDQELDFGDEDED